MTAAAPETESQRPDVPEPVLLRADRDGVAILTLNRPRAYNALSLDLMEAIIAEITRLDVDPAVKVVVIEGAGGRFCAGHDLKELRADPSRAFQARTFETCSRLMQGVQQLRQPVIAKVRGIAAAAGCQLVATCDLALAAEDARFGTPGVNIGLFCSTPMVALSRAVHRKQALELLLTGETIDADRAAAVGLINRAVPGERLDAECAALASKIAEKSRLVLKTGKEAFYRQIDMPLAKAYDYCAGVMVDNMAFDDAAEGIDAFIEKRRPIWKES